jgi:hypothetical protein
MSQMSQPPDDETIRPSLKLAAALVILGIAFVASWVVVSAFSVPESPGARRPAPDDWLAFEDPEPYAGRRRLGDPVAAGDPRWSPDGGTGFSSTGIQQEPREHDPQLERSIASLRHLGDAGVGEFSTLERTGHVTMVSGASPVAIGATCAVRVLPVLTSRFNCMVRVICDGVLLYPDPAEDAGYVACNVIDGMPSHAADQMASFQDTDPKVEVDLGMESVKVGDDTTDGASYLASIQLDRPRIFRNRRL